MTAANRFDYIIAGAGAAGLSLLWYMLQSESLKEKQILLVDLKLSPNHDKTWCFWDDSNLPMQELIHQSWDKLSVTAFGRNFTETLQRHKYHCVRSGEYTTRLLQLAKSADNVTMLESAITGFSEKKSAGVIHTEKGDFEAEWIFQSALRPENFTDLTVDISLKQHFLGVEIKTDKNIFDADVVTLMDFDTDQERGVTFFYTLPYSENEALIEYTFFTSELLTKEEYMAGIHKYLHLRYGLSDNQFEITREEVGIIPMEDRRYPGWFNGRVLNIGTVGGLTKPTTGYTFTRIHKHSVEITKALANGMRPPDKTHSPYRFRVYDMMLLYLLENEPEMSVQIFHDLFKKNSFDRILAFLEERTSLAAELSIFSSLPYMPFFRSIWKMKHRIFTGA